ncbi:MULTISPECIES: C13 family peptidase [unclassified Pseudomonas]|uniref:C13 family peptidase n=1 Tax=unclassified Pseudomonas TaxID=196821 RepID=UPI000C869EBA|nr:MULTISPECIES: C13 family peptidase [unclassified Pseudomonas]PMV84147.1 peptidase C13 [Pseudomonas sp. GW101-1A09]PMV91959.1 peptidase C13 [Pseudomonas sp. FW306-2-2C-B10A]PMV93163.1 peptidase C13 [Pseudomonas sp. GW460-C8]PMV99720.1 peptidase C13 [Pseudomonas sp. MPR-TSA4]PMW13195.1 peptidase C13 [Pseudomonas sp. GW456-11-11-14-TSB2]
MRSLALLALTLLLTACGDGESLLPPDARLPDGGRYRGDLVNGLLQGQGRIDYPNGSWYAGEFDKGQWHGQGEWHGSNGEVYRGQFNQGLFDGKGTLTTSGSSYTGGFKLGRRDGEGTLKENAMTYRGEFRADQYSGLGRLELDDGSSYQGQFANGKPNGEGQRGDASGNQFTGHFKDGQLEGNGTFNSADGDIYVGGFKNNQLHGKGRYENADGDVWLGQFKEGSLNGKGELIGADGSHYIGQFSDWRFTGQGRLNLPDGSFYIGQFDNDSYSGRGTLVLTDGTVQSGTWVNGQRVRDADGKLLPDTLELGLLAQGRLLDDALSNVPASTPMVELYTLTLGGDGKQSVFLRESDYVSNMLSSRFGAFGQIRLVNHRDHLVDRPMATRENLRRAAMTLAERSGPEDLIFIYLTSHGSSEHELVLDQPRMELADLPADELAAVLAPLKNRDKIVVISSCYSGGFIPALKDERTLIMTASRADRVSFGCSEEANFTYFGDALFAQALNQTDDLEHAFKLAKATVAERELADGFEASEPQLWAPKTVLSHWQLLRKQQARKALQSVSISSKDAKSN